MRKIKKARKQVKIGIAEVVVNRKCQYGTCDKELAYVIDGHDLCFEHGRMWVSFWQYMNKAIGRNVG